jgi:hypothetical protein
MAFIVVERNAAAQHHHFPRYEMPVSDHEIRSGSVCP